MWLSLWDSLSDMLTHRVTDSQCADVMFFFVVYFLEARDGCKTLYMLSILCHSLCGVCWMSVCWTWVLLVRGIRRDERDRAWSCRACEVPVTSEVYNEDGSPYWPACLCPSCHCSCHWLHVMSLLPSCFLLHISSVMSFLQSDQLTHDLGMVLFVCLEFLFFQMWVYGSLHHLTDAVD